jgi:putative sigma-54 modulation protein
MNVQIETSQLKLSRNDRSEMSSHVIGTLSRFSLQIQHMQLTLKDVNGAKGGIDKICTLSTTFVHGGKIIVTEKAGNIYQALSRALRVMRNRVSQQLGRKQSQRYDKIAYPELAE